MSDHFLRFIPLDPHWTPTQEASVRATECLRAIVPTAEAVSADISDAIQFFDPGMNWSGVVCAACGADAEDWWGDAMDAAFGSRFEDLAVTAPCCGAPTSLNDLRFGAPAGFARFALEAMNPGVADTTPEQDRRLEDALGVSLRKIWQHL